MNRHCKDCDIDKDIQLFPFNKKRQKFIGFVCIDCSKARRKETYLTEEFQSKRKAYRSSPKVKETERLRSQRYAKNNPEKILEGAKKQRQEKREYRNEKIKEWRRSNKSRQAFYSKKRGEKVRSACIDKSNDTLEHIELTYRAASNFNMLFGDEYQVDHIIPIIHPNVCGLHVPWNMRLLDAKVNKSKGNKWDGTYENSEWETKWKVGKELHLGETSE